MATIASAAHTVARPMAQRPSLVAFAVLAAAAVIPAHALIPLASDVVQGILDSRKNAAANQDFASPGVAPDPDPLEKYRGLSIKPTPADLVAHAGWVKRQAAQSEAVDTLFERLSDVKTTGAAGLGMAGKDGPARLGQGQFYAFAAGGSAQLYNGASSIKTSASGLRALYQTLSEEDRQLAAQAGPADRAGQESSTSGSSETGAPASLAARPSLPSAATNAADSAQAASSAAQSILPAFAPLAGSASAAPADGSQPSVLPGSAIAGGASARSSGAGKSGAAGATRRLGGFSQGNAGGPNAAALSRDGDLPTVKVKGMEDVFNGGSQALDKK